MTLPFIISVPHAGLAVPDEVKDICILSEKDIRDDGDIGAAEIYLPLKEKVSELVTTDIARAILDMNRSEDNRSKDGIIKTHTCWDVPIYSEPLTEKVIALLIEKHYEPYHSELSKAVKKGVKLGLDCHTMADIGPPVGPDAGKKRPNICISNAKGTTCHKDWLDALSEFLSQTFEIEVSINEPFQGGYIIRSHANELPWIQIELSRAGFLSLDDKSDRFLEALFKWNKNLCH